MAVSISEVLESIKTSIASFADATVVLGSPVVSEPGLYVFAYMFSETPVFHASAARETEGISARSYFIRCLLISSPPNNYVSLEDGLRCLTEKPVLTLGKTAVQVTISSLSTEDLTRIFSSANVKLSLAIPFELKWTEV